MCTYNSDIPTLSDLKRWPRQLGCIGLIIGLQVSIPNVAEADEWAATLSRLKTLPAGFVAQCEWGDLVLKGPPGYAKFRVQESKLCGNKGSDHLICIAGAPGTDDSGRPVPDCKDLSGDFT
jgi:hypothetical protein